MCKALDGWPVVSPEAPDPCLLRPQTPAAPPLSSHMPMSFPRGSLCLASHSLASEIPPTFQDPEQGHLHCPGCSFHLESYL